LNLDLARQLERAEGMANAACVDARCALRPEVGAEWIDVAGTFAMFDGPASPLTQTFGLGLFGPFGASEFDRVEEFFGTRGAPTSHEVCSFASTGSISLLGSRGYSPIEASAVLVQPIAGRPPAEQGPIIARTIKPDEADLWSSVATDGWAGEMPELREFLQNMGAVVSRARGVTCFLAELEGLPIATAALNVQNGVALLAGAATIPSARRQGAQRALFNARLDFAAQHHIMLAMVVTQPGSQSQRNAERQGFRPAYTRVKWQKPASSE
jgi:GNAT superfamily N-acetyltransferase